jgi:hypothetical protein
MLEELCAGVFADKMHDTSDFFRIIEGGGSEMKPA